MALRFNSILFAICLIGTCQAQSFFKKIPAPRFKQSIIGDSVVTRQPDKEMSVFRPVANITSYAIPSNALLTGGGVSYQRLKWNGTKWVVKWSISALAWYQTALDGKKNAAGLGATFGLFNNVLLLGFGYSNKWFGTIGPGINLN